jgi:D-xylonolactonase
MTVDSNGDIWSARAGGFTLNRYSPKGKELQSIKFPALMVSSVTFGGENLDDIYVTTIGGENKKENGSGAGALFHLNLGIKGNPEFLSEILL